MTTTEAINTIGPILLSLVSVPIALYNPWPKREARGKRRVTIAEAQGVPRGVRTWLAWWDDGELRKIVRESHDPAVPEAARLEWDRRQLVRPAAPSLATHSPASLLRPMEQAE